MRNVLIVAVLMAVLAAFAVPALLKRTMEAELTALLGRAVSVANTGFNPVTLTASIEGLEIAGAGTGTGNGSQPALLSVKRADVSLSLASLWHRAPVLDRVTIEGPVISIARTSPSGFDVDDIVKRIAARPPSSEPVRFAVENIRVVGGTVTFDDRVEDARHAVTGIELGVPFISNLPRHANIHTDPHFAAMLNGTAIRLAGHTRPFAQGGEGTEGAESTLDIRLDRFHLPTYATYLPESVLLRVKAGTLDADMKLVFRQAQGKSQASVQIRGDAVLNDAELLDAAGEPLVRAAHLRFEGFNLTPLAKRYELGRITLTKPDIRIAREADGRINWQKLVALAPQTAPPPPAPATPGSVTQVAFSALSVGNGAIDFTDARARNAPSGAPFRQQVTDIGIRVGSFDTAKPAMATALALVASDASKAALGIHGNVTLMQGEAALDIGVERLLPAAYAAYWQPHLSARIEGGALSGGAKLTLGADWRIDNLAIAADSARVAPLVARAVSLPPDALERLNRAATAPIVQFDTLAANGISIDGATRVLRIAAIDARAMRANLLRQQTWNVEDLLPPPRASLKLSADESPTPPASSTTPPAPWSWRIDTVRMTGGASVIDATHATPVRISLRDTTLAVDALAGDTATRATVKLATGINRRGRLTLAGSVQPARRDAVLDIDARELDLANIDPLVSPLLNVQLASGRMAWQGRVTAGLPQAGAAIVRAAGKASITEFLALDKVNGEPFARWKTLGLDGVDVRVGDGPLLVSLGGIALADYYARLIVNANGRLNALDVVATPKVEVGPQAPSPSITTPGPVANPRAAPVVVADVPKPVVRIGRVTLADGNIEFTDNFVKPNVNANLTGMSGSLSAVASDAPAPAEVLLRGRLDDDAPVEVKGRTNPLASPLYLDMQASAKGIELTRLTPYSAKYAGYAIEKGKLSMDIRYNVQNGKLNADNRLFLDQLTFGERVEGPDVTKLPVRLAVSLLTNSRGEIDLNLPIAGSLDDPEFSVGGIILQVIVNLLGKAITSPFALIGAAFGGGEELSHIGFAPGSAALDDAARERLVTLAKVMKDRPAVKLDVTGHADTARDAEPWRRARLAELVRAEKVQSMVGRGRSVDTAAVTVSAEEYPKFLEAVYKEASFPKPRNLLGMAKSLPVAEMETLILTNMSFGEAEQRALAIRRADAARNVLRGALGEDVFGARVFGLAPKLGSAGKAEVGVGFGLR